MSELWDGFDCVELAALANGAFITDFKKELFVVYEFFKSIAFYMQIKMFSKKETNFCL